MAKKKPAANQGPPPSPSEAAPPPSPEPVPENAAMVVKPGGLKALLKSEDVQLHDFRQPAFLNGAELRRIRLRHDEFIRSLASHLSNYLRLEVAMEIARLQTVSFRKYAEALPSPTHLTLFKIEPLRGVCLLDMAPRLGLTIVDRLLGGPAQSANANVEMTEIELALLDQVVQVILSEWCQLWHTIENARSVLLGHENHGPFLNSSPPDTVMLVVSMKVRLGDCDEQMQLAFPFLTIEPLIRTGSRGGGVESAAVSKRGPLKWNPRLDDVDIRLSTEWHGLKVSARELAGLKPGDVLMLDAACFNKVEVRFEHQPKFNGRLGTSGDRWAVELTEAVKS